MAPAPPALFPAPVLVPSELRARQLESRGRTEALCGHVVPRDALAAALEELGPAPVPEGALMPPDELLGLAAVARMVREDLRLLAAFLAAIVPLSPAERVHALRA